MCEGSRCGIITMLAVEPLMCFALFFPSFATSYYLYPIPIICILYTSWTKFAQFSKNHCIWMASLFMEQYSVRNRRIMYIVQLFLDSFGGLLDNKPCIEFNSPDKSRINAIYPYKRWEIHWEVHMNEGRSSAIMVIFVREFSQIISKLGFCANAFLDTSFVQ